MEYWRKCVTPYIVDGKPRGWVVDQETGFPMRWSGIGNVLFYTFPYYLNKMEPQIHSTQKPILALCNFIMSTTNVGDTVFDMFAGSMSCGVASVLCERNFIGVERESEMYAKGKKWLENINYAEAENYVKTRLSSGEAGFKFGFDSRKYQKKPAKTN
jgi:site-specific DNA-methyltransferase (adenine-specific)